jgi:S1-C subfamily serine protease
MSMNQVVLALARQVGGQGQLLGTCFAVGPGRLATALHVIGNDDSNLVVILPRTGDFADYQDTTDTAVHVIPVRLETSDNFRDLCILEGPADAKFPFFQQISGSDECPPGVAVLAYGFPHADQGRMILTLQPATVGARILLEKSGIKSKHMVLNVQTRPGQSGSPVVNAVTGRLCGVITGSYAPAAAGILLGNINPATLHQTSHAISAEYLKEMI